NAHKIRKIRHLRGAKARCTSKKIRAIGAIREHAIISECFQWTAIFFAQITCILHSLIVMC
ncbi:hypothetical protein, partial [Prevotellamassilia timonensis]|uniref:hypothetical protein n=1 Tax=Prevotellamassilia timonensis TaxID=1852370 RepID=UPI00402988E3